MDRKHNVHLTANAKALRRNMTKEERHLWYDFLKTYLVRFLRQKVIDDYIVDFYCHDARLVVELDGSQHFDPAEQEKDAIRTERIQNRGLLVIRIPNNTILRISPVFVSILTGWSEKEWNHFDYPANLAC